MLCAIFEYLLDCPPYQRNSILARRKYVPNAIRINSISVYRIGHILAIIRNLIMFTPQLAKPKPSADRFFQKRIIGSISNDMQWNIPNCKIRGPLGPNMRSGWRSSTSGGGIMFHMLCSHLLDYINTQFIVQMSNAGRGQSAHRYDI